MPTDYYDIDDLLAGQQKVQCVFYEDAPGIGFLEGPQTRDIQRGAKVDVPAWLAASSNFRQLVRVETPKTMGPRARAHWLADPTVINLNDYAPFFYLFGLKVSEITDDRDLAEAIIKVFEARLPMIRDLSQHTLHTDVSDVARKLEATEKDLFRCSSQAATMMTMWKSRESTRLTAAESDVKRRRTMSGPGP